ncbi:hypothetical protein SDC9_24282 [bioreactor metagenome]|uniref:peptidylprolyl isomerase n=1 Tax=bioreactor metagenome TaxID=1076179 RepID=A0A644UHD7_9ZZZZ
MGINYIIERAYIIGGYGMKKFYTSMILLACLMFFTACSNQENRAGAAKATVVNPTTAVFTTNMGTFEATLATKDAPLTCDNFIKLAKKGFYNGTIFHRIIPGFMIQGGDPKGNGMGGPGYTIKDEFSPMLKHDKAGVLSMANAGPNTGGSQFFITLAPTPWLDGKHAVFGRVTKGMDVVDKIGKVLTDSRDKPISDVVIKSIEIKKS